MTHPKALAIAALFAAAPASAQVVFVPIFPAPGVDRPCLTGEPRKADMIAAARASAERNFARYLRVAGAGAPADVSALFGKRKQIDVDRYPLGVDDLHAADDPLARRYAAAGGDPAIPADAFVVAGGRKTALGRWALRDAAAVLGYYRVRFGAQGRDWTILSMERFAGADVIPTIPQYCYEPGDLYGQRGELLPLIEPPPVRTRPLPRFLGEEVRRKRLALIARIQGEP